MSVKLKSVDSLKNGGRRFRRECPKKLAETFDLKPMQQFFKNWGGAALHREYALLLAKLDRRQAELEQRSKGGRPKIAR